MDPYNHDLKPDKEFLSAFADVVGSKWPSLATTLSLSEDEIKEMKRDSESLFRQDHAFLMLSRWASREDATYGQLCLKLKKISLFNGNLQLYIIIECCSYYSVIKLKVEQVMKLKLE